VSIPHRRRLTFLAGAAALVNGVYVFTGLAHPATASATEDSVPAPVTEVTSTTASNSVVLTWIAPIDDVGSPLTAFAATATNPTDAIAVHTCRPAPLTALTCTIFGLTPGVTYEIDVVATNNFGNSPATTTSATTMSTLTIPATIDGLAAPISWQAVQAPDGATGYRSRTRSASGTAQQTRT
jgi:hypothetical protein